AAARPAEEVGVVHTVGAQRGAQRIGHLRLTDQLGKGLWPVTAIQGGNHSLIVVAAADTRAWRWGWVRPVASGGKSHCSPTWSAPRTRFSSPSSGAACPQSPAPPILSTEWVPRGSSGARESILESMNNEFRLLAECGGIAH